MVQFESSSHRQCYCGSSTPCIHYLLVPNQGPSKSKPLSNLYKFMINGSIYVSIHTTEFPHFKVRGDSFVGIDDLSPALSDIKRVLLFPKTYDLQVNHLVFDIIEAGLAVGQVNPKFSLSLIVVTLYNKW
jgi:hypothetical protein